MMGLPTSWAPTHVGEICTALQYGYTAAASEEACGPRLLRITDIQNGLVQWPKVPYCEIDANQAAKFELRAGDIVFARTGGTVGKSYIIATVPEPAVFASYLIRLSAHPEIDPRFLYYFFQSGAYWEQIGLKKGGLQGNVNATTLSSLELSVCALNEQRRIVAKIEQLFSEIDKGVESLKTAREQLRVYRQAVLEHAFGGKLTARWREEYQDKLESADKFLGRIKTVHEACYQQQLAAWSSAVNKWEASGQKGKKPLKPALPKFQHAISANEIDELPSLPSGWNYARLGNFIDAINAGKSFRCDEREPLEHEVGVAKVSAVTWGEYDEKESKTCRNPDRENPELFIKPGDFLLSRANTIELVGACVIVKNVTRRIMLSDKTLRMDFSAGNKVFFLHFLRSHTGRNEIMKRSTGNQESMRNIGQDRIRNIILPLASAPEMAEVVSRIETMFSHIDAMNAVATDELLRVESLRHSILKSAFSGQLVAQDPSDEPAFVLLARIKAEKAELNKDNKNKNKSKNKNKNNKTRDAA